MLCRLAGFTLIASKKAMLVKHLMQHSSGLGSPVVADPEVYEHAEQECIKINFALGNIIVANNSERGILLRTVSNSSAAPLLVSNPAHLFTTRLDSTWPCGSSR